MSRSDRSVLITGVSSGIGLGMTKKFLAQGHRVIGSVRSQEKAEELRSTLGDRFSPLVFDLCNQSEIDASEKKLQAALGDQQLVALINNAGSAEIGPLLHVPPDDFRRQLDTLVVGHLRVIQRFYKYLIPPNAPPGRILNISSVSGVGVNNFFGCYAAGKHALEGLSKTLRYELRTLGIQVIVVAPGNIATEIWPKQTADMISRYESTDYFPALKRSVETINSSTVKNAMSVADFCDALYEVFATPEPADRYTIVKARRPGVPFSRLTRMRVRSIQG